MLIDKELGNGADKERWIVTIEKADNNSGLGFIVQRFEELLKQIDEENVHLSKLILDLEKLKSINSEIVAQIVMMQSKLSRREGKMHIIAQQKIKPTFDSLKLEGILDIEYR